MLGTVDDQHPGGIDLQPARGQVGRDRGSLVRAAAMRRVAQHCLQLTARGELPQGGAQQVGLPGQRRVVEVQVHQARRHGLLVDALAVGQRRLADEGPAADLAADQPDRLELRIDA